MELKPVLHADALAQLKALAQKPLALPQAAVAVLEPATQRVAVDAFQQAVRAAVVSIRQALVQIESETDPLVRYLGLRALSHEVTASGFEPRRLTEPDEQKYAQQLMNDVTGREALSLGQLEVTARTDLNVLLNFEQRVLQREQALQTKESAESVESTTRALVERAQREYQRQTRVLAKLPANPRPLWLRLLGLVIALMAFAGFVTKGKSVAAPPQWQWGWIVGSILFAVGGLWLCIDPWRRRGWLVSSLQRLAETKRTAIEKEAHAAEALARARTVFDTVEAACREEEVAALAVLQRRPGVQRYVSTPKPVWR